MKIILPLIVAGVFLACSGRALADESCNNFTFEVDAADHAYADWPAYIGSGQSDEADTSFQVFSHFLDVANEYYLKCDDMSAHEEIFRTYFKLDWFRQEHNYSGAALADKRTIVAVQDAEINALWTLHFAKVDPADYSVMKQTTMGQYSELGLEFKSPETGKIVIKANPRLATCDRNDHDATFTGITLVYPSDAMKARFGGAFDVFMYLDTQGNPSLVSVTMPGFADLNDGNRMELAINVMAELKSQVEATTWGAAIRDCVAAKATLHLTAYLDSTNQDISLAPWQPPVEKSAP